MDHVYLVWHIHELPTGEDDEKFIGAYLTQEDAEAAVRRTEVLEGFRDAKDDFSIVQCEIGKDNWTSGHLTDYIPAASPSHLIENWKEYRVTLDVSVDDARQEKKVVIRGTREALTMVSNLISTVARDEENSASLAPGSGSGDLLSASSSGLEIVRVGPRRSPDYDKYDTYDSIRGIYEIVTED